MNFQIRNPQSAIRNRKVRVRFAPSPTGPLHVGNLRTALFNWLFARQQKGRFVLRIEDTDLERSRPEYEQQIYEDLTWFGLDWDEGPMECGMRNAECGLKDDSSSSANPQSAIRNPQSYGPYRQSQRLEVYPGYAERLLREGQAYYCFCTSEELEGERERAKAQGVPYTYSGRCRAFSRTEVEDRLSQGQPFTVRFRVRSGSVSWEDLVRGRVDWQGELLGDFVILKSDGWPVYNFAVVVDDIGMEISHVIRGDGHLPNTPRQILLYEALNAAMPKFGHLSTILGPDGTKLSKRHGATSVTEFREHGYLPEALFNFLALLGWSPEGGSEILSRHQLIEQFSLERVGKAPAIFDVEKLKWMNRSYLKQADQDRLVKPAAEYLKRAGRLKDVPMDDRTHHWLRLVLDAVLTYLDNLSQIVPETAVIFDYDLPKAAQTDEVREVLEDSGAIEIVRAWRDEWQKAEGRMMNDELKTTSEAVHRSSFIVHRSKESFQAATTAVKQKTGRQGRALFHPIRMALTARTSGPELVKLVPIFELGSQLDLPQPLPGVLDRLNMFLDQ